MENASFQASKDSQDIRSFLQIRSQPKTKYHSAIPNNLIVPQQVITKVHPMKQVSLRPQQDSKMKNITHTVSKKLNKKEDVRCGKNDRWLNRINTKTKPNFNGHQEIVNNTISMKIKGRKKNNGRNILGA